MKEARNKFLSALKPLMAKHSFRFRASDDVFWRTDGDFTCQWQTRFLAGASSVEVEPSIGIRSEIVERLFHSVSKFSPELQAGTSTIGASLANLEGVNLGTYTYRVAADEDVLPVASALFSLFHIKAAPFYEKYSNLGAIDHLLNDRPSENIAHCRYGLPRESRGLIVAKLVGRSDYDELKAYYRSRIVKISGGFYVTQFEALIALLEKEGQHNHDFPSNSTSRAPVARQ